MFTEKGQAFIDLAKDFAFAQGRRQVDLEALLGATSRIPEAQVRLARCLTNGDASKLRSLLPELELAEPCPGKLDPDGRVRQVIDAALDLASEKGVPHMSHPGLIDLRHIACGLAMSAEACRMLVGTIPISRETALELLGSWYQESGGLSLAELLRRLRDMRSELRGKVFGQDHAVQAFIEGIYNAEMTATADVERSRPTGVFVFAGPPGVGKTYLAELCTSHLSRPFKRFDMTAYTDHQAHNQLIGFSQVYKGAQPGVLTDFVERNPNAVLLFDEIEKAHINTIQLFYQLLDAGKLEDKHSERNVDFKDTMIIFTTNAGRSLYDNPNRVGITAANANYHRRTILSALENEVNPSTGKPAFPQAICSRLAQGYPIMFNHLGVNELVQVCDATMKRTEALIERQYFKSIEHDSLLPFALVFREGARIDARQIKAEADKFVKSEIFQYGTLYSGERLEDALEEIDVIRFEVNSRSHRTPDEVRAILESPELPRVLLVANHRFAGLYWEHIPEVQWLPAATMSDALDTLATEEVDLVLLDIWIRREMAGEDPGDLKAGVKEDETWRGPDFVPLSSRALDEGRQILQRIHERFPQAPVYLLSFDTSDSTASMLAETPMRRPIDDELFLACVRAGGARGMVKTGFISRDRSGWKMQRSLFASDIVDLAGRLYREKSARKLARERKVLSFATSMELKKEIRELTIRLGDFSLSQAINAMDAGEMVEDVERPVTRFSDVVGAKAAKESFQFLVDWLRSPRRYTPLGIRSPRGILLTGPPGTGKTMLARAVAGETECAFLEKSASSFITIWQGSGPQNVRDLFARARRYAPSIVFIDEIDTIGIGRSGMAGAGRAQEETLNALLTEMDGFRADKDLQVVVLAATNLADRLDEALKRRFDRVIELEKPDRAERLLYLERAMEQRKQSTVEKEVLERLAKQTVNWSIADLDRVIQEAAVMAAHKGKPLSGSILEEAFEKIRSGEIKDPPDRTVLERTARHEAGHALIAWLGGRPPIAVDIIGRGNRGGVMEREVDERGRSYTKGELEQLIREALGGRASELLYYGPEEGLSTGPSCDLQQVTELATKMVTEFGMSEEIGHLALPCSRRFQGGNGDLTEKELAAVRAIVDRQIERTTALLKGHREYLDRLANELLERNRLTMEDLQGILPRVGN
jgi:ATP-dependent metalloprotease FtsH